MLSHLGTASANVLKFRNQIQKSELMFFSSGLHYWTDVGGLPDYAIGSKRKQILKNQD